MNNYKEEIEERLAADVNACDFQWSIFYCALFSYRHDTVLRPLPPLFEHNENDYTADISKLRQLSEQIPTLKHLKDESLVPQDKLHLLHWVLNSNNFSLRSISKSNFAKIKQKTGQLLPTAEPTHIFRVIHNDLANSRYSALRQVSNKTFYAYHGSRLENFYSILQNGIHKRMNKNSLFGEGTYLSSELSVCMHYSPSGPGWPKSILGDRLSCTAVCQLIDHPDVKCQLRDVSDNKSNTSRVRPRDSVGGDIPEKYFLVQNDELIRVKYILVYAEITKHPSTTRSSLDWFSRHRFAIIMLAYLFMLMAVGIFNSRPAKLYLNKFLFA